MALTPRQVYKGNPATPGYEPNKDDIIEYLNGLQTRIDAASPVYDSIAEGLAGTTVGQFFNAFVDGKVNRYRHDPGPIATFIYEFPSSVAIEEVYALLASIGDYLTGTLTELTSTYSGDGTSDPLELITSVDDPAKIELSVNGATLRPGIDYDSTGVNLIPLPGGDYSEWPVGVNNILVRIRRQLDLTDIPADQVTYDGGTVTAALDTLLPENVIRLSDYMHPTDLAAVIAGNTAAQDGSRVTASIRAFHEACLSAMFTGDGASIVGEWPAGIYRINDRLMSDAFNNLNWSTTAFGRSRFRMRTDGNVRLRIQNWIPGRAAMRTDGIYAGSSYISPIAVFEWFQPTGVLRFAGIDGKFVIEGADSIATDPMGWYFYRLNGSRFTGELEVLNLRNRTFVWDSIFNTQADYIVSRQAAGVMLTEAGGSGLLTADVVAGNVRTGLRYTLSGANITINTMAYDSVAGTYAFTPANVFTADHVGKWIALDRQGRTNLVGDSPDDEADGGSSRRSARWYQISSVTDASTAVLSVAPPQQGTTGQMAAQNRTFSFGVLKCDVTAGSNIATLSMPITESLVGFEVSIPGAHYTGLPARHPILCAMVTAHTGNTVTLSHAAGVTRTGVPFIIAPQVTIGSLSQTQFLTNSRKVDDFHVNRMWCESGQVGALPLLVQDATNITMGDETKLHGVPLTNNVNFGANFAAVVAGDIGARWAGRYTHSRHSREFGMFYLTGDRSELKIDGELSSWTADDQTAIFYIDPSNVATTRIWDVYFNASDYAFGFPDTSAGQVFERGGPNYTPGRVKAGASQRSPRGERPSWPPAQMPPSRAPAWGSTRADAVAAIARGWVPENGVEYDIENLGYIGSPGATLLDGLPGLLPLGNRVDLGHLGVVPSNSAADAAGNVAKINAAIAWLSGLTNGGILVARAYEGAQANPIITINAPLILKPGVSIDFGPNVRFRATSAMSAMLLSEPGAGNRLRNQRIRGGDWNGNNLADYVFRFAEFEYLHVDACSLRNGLVGGVAVGGNIIDLSTNPYEFMLTNCRVSRSGVRAATDYGVRSLGSVSDSHILNNLIVGYEYGVSGPWFISKFGFNHSWAAPSEGSHSVGFHLTGRNSILVGNQVDSPQIAAYHIDEQFVSMSANAVSQKQFTPIPAILLGSNADKFTCYGLLLNDEAGFPSTQIDPGSKTDYTIVGTISRSGQPTPDFSRGWRRDYEEGTFGVVFRDASGNSVATGTNGRWERTGNVVRVTWDIITVTNPVGVVTTDQLRIDLPFQTTEQVFGTIGSTQLAYGTGRTFLQPYAASNATFATIQAYGAGTGSRDILWSDVTSGTTSLRGFSLQYKVT